MTAPNQSSLAQTQDLSGASAHFCVAASLTNAAAQYVPPSALQSSLTQTPGILFSEARTITKMRVQFEGDGANVAQTVSFGLNRRVGTAAYAPIAQAAISGASAVATTAGTKSATVDFTSSPLNVAAGDTISPFFTPSAGLGGVLTNVHISFS